MRSPFKKDIPLQPNFVSRTDHVHFFEDAILKAERPQYNIISISGETGVGKTTLLHHFRDIARSTDFKDHCLTALVDEKQVTPAEMMEKFAEQLKFGKDFQKALNEYKEIELQLQAEHESIGKSLFVGGLKVFGATAQTFLGPFGALGNTGATIASDFVSKQAHQGQLLRDADRRKNSVKNLTQAFLNELNELAAIVVGSTAHQRQHKRKILLFFDSFASTIDPWLFQYILEGDIDIESNIVFIRVGRQPLQHSNQENDWLRYNSVIKTMHLESFSEEETRTYLLNQGISGEQSTDLWKLTRGLPIYLYLLTRDPYTRINPTKSIADNILRSIPEQDIVKRHLAFSAALFSRPFNQGDVEAFTDLEDKYRYLPQDRNQQVALSHWLIEQDFVSYKDSGRYSYTDGAKRVLSEEFFRSSPNEYYATRTALASHYRKQLERLQAQRGEQVYNANDWLELAKALIHQLFLLPDPACHIEAIEWVLTIDYKAKKSRDILGLLNELAQEPQIKHINPDIQAILDQLIHYLNSDPGDAGFLEASNYLLEKAEKASSFSPGARAFLYRGRGLAHFLLYDAQKALQDLNAAIHLTPDEDLLYAARGAAYLLANQPQQALKDMEQALHSGFKDEWIYTAHGLAAIITGNTQQALEDLQQAFDLAPNESWNYFVRGLAFFTRMEYKRALADFDAGIQLDEDAIAHTFRGLTLASLGERDQALEACNRALELASQLDETNPLKSTSSGLAYFVRGLIYVLSHNFEQSIEELTKAINLLPNEALFYAVLGWAYASSGKLKEAFSNCEQAMKLAPRLAVAYIARGTAYAVSNELDKAHEDLNEALQLNPRLILALLIRGRIYLVRYELEHARKDFEQVLQLLPNKEEAPGLVAQAQAGLGRVHALLQDQDQALRSCKEALALSPQDTQVYIDCSITYLSFNQFAEAIKLCNRAIKLNRKLSDAYLQRGLAYIRLAAQQQTLNDLRNAAKSYERAERDYRRTLKMQPQQPQAHFGLSLLHIARQEFQQALHELDIAIQLAPGDAEAYLSRGKLNSLRADYQKSLDDYNRAITLAPRWALAYYERGLIYLTMEDNKKALSDFNKALSLVPNWADVYVQRAIINFSLKNAEQAIKDCTQALELKPDLALAYYYRGLSQGYLKHYEEARKDFDRAIQYAPDLLAAYNRRGQSYCSLDQFEEAIKDFTEVLNKFSQRIDAIRESDPEELMKRANIFLLPDFPPAQEAAPNMNSLLEQLPSILEALQKNLFSSDSFFAWTFRGMAYMELGKYEQGIADFDEVLDGWKFLLKNDFLPQKDLLPLPVEHIWFMRGICNLWLKNIEQAKDDFNESEKANPENMKASLMVNWLAMCQEPISKRARHLERIARISPDSYEAHICQGIILYLQGKVEEALLEQEKATELEPDEAFAYFWKGLIAVSSRQAEGIDAIKKALQLKLPPVLLAPLRSLEKDIPEFYTSHIQPLLEQYKKNGRSPLTGEL